MEMETFDEYWAKSPGLGELATFSKELVVKIAEAAYVSGQASASTAINNFLKN